VTDDMRQLEARSGQKSPKYQFWHRRSELQDVFTCSCCDVVMNEAELTSVLPSNPEGSRLREGRIGENTVVAETTPAVEELCVNLGTAPNRSTHVEMDDGHQSSNHPDAPTDTGAILPHVTYPRSFEYARL
jgi:hypothetical protein